MSEVNDQQDSNKLESLIDEIKEKINRIKTFNSNQEIGSYCDDLEAEILLTTESAIDSIYKLQKKWVDEVNSYKNELLERTSSASAFGQDWDPCIQHADGSHLKKEFAKLSIEIEKFSESAVAFFNENKSVNKFVQFAEDKAKEYDVKLKKMEKKLLKSAFQGRFLKFKENNLFALFLDQLGCLEISQEANFKSESKRMDLPLILDFPGYHSPINSVLCFTNDFFDDGNYSFAVGTINGEFYILSLPFNSFTWDYRYYSSHLFMGCINSIVQLHDKHLAIGFEDQINIFNVEHKCVQKILKVDKKIVSMRYYNGKLITLAHDGSITIWDSLRNYSLLQIANNPSEINMTGVRQSFGILSNGNLINFLNCHDNSKLQVWNIQSGRLVWRMNVTEISPGLIESLLVLDDDLVALSFENGSIKIFNVGEKTLHRTLCSGDASFRTWTMAQLPNGYLVSVDASKSPQLRVWNPLTGKLVGSLPSGSLSEITSMHVSEDGKTLATGSTDQSLKIWYLKQPFQPIDGILAVI